jgi:hypothetical protein
LIFFHKNNNIFHCIALFTSAICGDAYTSSGLSFLLGFCNHLRHCCQSMDKFKYLIYHLESSYIITHVRYYSSLGIKKMKTCYIRSWPFKSPLHFNWQKSITALCNFIYISYISITWTMDLLNLTGEWPGKFSNFL